MTEKYPVAHGGPIQIGPDALGIRDIHAPEYGEPVTIKDGEVPFWACGVTPQEAIRNTKPRIMITMRRVCRSIWNGRREGLKDDGDARQIETAVDILRQRFGDRLTTVTRSGPSRDRQSYTRRKRPMPWCSPKPERRCRKSSGSVPDTALRLYRSE